ncbi:MAG: hypothetical protein M1454_02670 [Candidatus Thermoplasmatota archaeon]|nr:hypothetical protein [Candidatus Thermoplasmatota archaeon]MCL5731109.1 hypothetical protein [Candidatus Thermoplasmatota archaeon]
MKLAVGQKIDIEVDREDLELAPVYRNIIATWYNNGNPIYIELEANKSMIKEIWKLFEGNEKRTELFSIYRASQKKYMVEPTMVLLNGSSKGNDSGEED